MSADRSPTCLSRHREQFPQPHNIVNLRCKGEGSANTVHSAKFRAAHAGDRFHAAKAFLDALGLVEIHREFMTAAER